MSYGIFETVGSRPSKGGDEGVDHACREALRRTVLLKQLCQFFEPASEVILGDDRILLEGTAAKR